MSLTIGILVIGSLYWDNDKRERWRESRLRRQDEILVAVPIRYGRLSTKGRREDTYTMVFSSSLGEFGTAKVLRCIHDVMCPTDLLDEARSLWAAEDPNASTNSMASGFGCVVLLRNPNGTAANAFVEEWAREAHFKTMSRKIEEGRLISDQGLLQIRGLNGLVANQ